jgi:DNA-binding MarR family transcriptional regulator
MEAEVEEDLSTRLRLTVGRLARRMRQLYAQGSGVDRLAFLEVAVLSSLRRKGPTSPGRLAGEERVTAPAVAAALRSLVAQGLVYRRPDQLDRRRMIVAITPEGERVLRDRDRIVTARISAILAEQFTDLERDRLAELLTLADRLANHL